MPDRWLMAATCQWRNGRCDWCAHPTHTCDSPPTEDDMATTDLPADDATPPDPTTLDGIRDVLSIAVRKVAAIQRRSAAEQAPFIWEIERLTAELNDIRKRNERSAEWYKARAEHYVLAHHRLQTELGHKKPERTLRLPYGVASIHHAVEWDWPTDPAAVVELTSTLAQVDPSLVRTTVSQAPQKLVVKKHPAFAIDEASGAVIVKATGEKLPIHVTTVDRVTITTTGGPADAPQ